MARCPKCRRSFATLEDEADMHDCPYCGWYPGRDDEADDEEDADERD